MKKNSYKKVLAVVIFALFIGPTVAPTIGAIMKAESNSDYKTGLLTCTQQFSEPTIIEKNECIKLTLKETNTYIAKPTHPNIPVYTQTFELPWKTKITDIHASFTHKNTKTLGKHIAPVPKPEKIGKQIIMNSDELNQEIYQSNQYPTSTYTLSKGVGLNKNNERVLHLTIRMYPVIYKPQKNEIDYYKNAELKIAYTYPTNQPQPTGDPYDLVIITPQLYENNLLRLVDHKQSHEMNTVMITLEEIYDTYPGRDKPEKIKYYVKDAVETNDIKYILLVGDIKKTPIRTTYASPWEADILADLYYSDIYDENYSFCGWDNNQNNRFGEVFDYDYDIDGVDLYPDVHIGRLACRNSEEVETVVQKIITYEDETYGKDWFKKIVLAGGDTFPLIYRGATPFVFEGEITNQAVADQLPDFTHKKLWATKRNLNYRTFNRAINQGAGFVTYAGHGFEHGWGTYKPNALRDKMILYYISFIQYLRNEEKLPILFFDACLTAKLDFNMTDLDEYYPWLWKILHRLTGISYDPSNYFPCVAWRFVSEQDGGTIATVGSTRTAYTWVNKTGVYGGAGYLDVAFFSAYKEGVTAGEMLSQAQVDYISNVFKDFFTIEEYILLGDPSLRVGGYP